MRGIKITPDDQDASPLTLREIKDHLRIEHDLEDDIIAKIGIGAARMIETECRRLLSPCTVAVTYAYPRLAGDTLGFDNIATSLHDPDSIYRGITLPRSPVRSITSVELVSLDGSSESMDETLYWYDEYEERILWTDGILSQSNYETPTIRVMFEAGYDTGSVPEDIKRAILIICTDLYENRDSEVVYVPKKASYLLAKYKKSNLAG